MYGEEGGAEAATAGGGGARRFNLEGLIPLILLVIIGVASLNYFGVINVPYLPKSNQHLQVLFLGKPTVGEMTALDNLSGMLSYQVRDTASFGTSASEELSQYDMIIIDQTILPDKSVSVALGQALQNYVKKGGKMIVVGNSAIYQSVGFSGLTATDAIGWKANLGDIMPVECNLGPNSVPTCMEQSQLHIAGRIRRQIYDHPIMNGVELVPPVTQGPYPSLGVLDVQTSDGSKTVAYIQSENTPRSYPAIVEKKSFPFGTVVYFNYDPGMTITIFTNTIMYLG